MNNNLLSGGHLNVPWKLKHHLAVTIAFWIKSTFKVKPITRPKWHNNDLCFQKPGLTSFLKS